MIRVQELAKVLGLKSQDLAHIILHAPSLGKELKVNALADLEDALADRIVKVVQELRPALITQETLMDLEQKKKANPPVERATAQDQSANVRNRSARGSRPKAKRQRLTGNLRDWDFD